MRLRVTLFLLLFLLLGQNVMAKDWRGIVPLKSTRADVERRFGKPGKWGYEFKAERVSFDYREEPCKGLYLALGEDNCKCLADENAVMSIFVEPTVKQKVSDLKLDMKTFRRTPINPYPHTFEYDNPTEGITYTVDEPEDEITTITYYPSPVDCQEIISKRAPKNRNSWRDLVPLHSNRRDVEALFGSPKHDWETSVTYETDQQSILAKYSHASCGASSADWNVPKDTLIELTVNPNPSFLLQELHLDARRYERHEIFPYPEIDNPPKVWNYVDKLDGVTIRVQSSRGGGGEEVVVSITYQPARLDQKLHCERNAKSTEASL